MGNQIHRHQETKVIFTDLDPIEDLMILISSLKSSGFTSDLLNETHKFTDVSEIDKTAKLITLHISNAIGLAEQAFEGPAETSFLPLYYSTLNLSKVFLLTKGKRIELEKNRWHGATYDPTELKKDFLEEKISIKQDGSIPLIYNEISKNKIGKKGLNLSLNEVYSNILGVSAEYSTITKLPTGMMGVQIKFIRNNEQGHFIKIICTDKRSELPSPDLLKAFSELKLVKKKNGKKYYESVNVTGDFEEVKNNLIGKINRHLISDTFVRYSPWQEWISFIPVTNRNRVFNEELCIMLAYFHLSNIVRYNPEHLYKLVDSKYWPIMLSLRKHGFLQFQKLMWGNFIKKSFGIA